MAQVFYNNILASRRVEIIAKNTVNQKNTLHGRF